MMRVTFHVGMGKTGSSTIQSALTQNIQELADKGVTYLGQWMDVIIPEMKGFLGFQSFLLQSPTNLEASAHLLLDHMVKVSQDEGVHEFLISNEQYLENIQKLDGFFRILASHVELRIVMFVRPPATWLPSAFIQWGVVHKTNLGPALPFETMARRLMKQYEFIRQWREAHGNNVILKQFDESTDVVEEFARIIGVKLVSPSHRKQKRPSVNEIIMRASFNNGIKKIALPGSFDQLISQKIPQSTPLSLESKFQHLFDYRDIPNILRENFETLNYIEREFEIDITSQHPPEIPSFDLPALTDDLLGNILDIVFSQAHQIQDLRTRLEALERQNHKP